MIQLTKIQKTYRTEMEQSVDAAQDVNLHIRAGDFVAVTGASGSGKSTLLNLIGCLDAPDSGSYKLNDAEVTTMDDRSLSQLRAETFGFVFQSFHLLPSTSVEENVALPLVYRPGFTPPRDVEELLESVGLGDRGDHLPNELSGGQKQRVAIARALIGDPKVLLADEPTGNLDSKSTEEILSLLETLNRNGRTLLMVTHDKELADKAHRVIVMEDGRVVEDTSNSASTGAPLEETQAQANPSPQPQSSTQEASP